MRRTIRHFSTMMSATALLLTVTHMVGCDYNSQRIPIKPPTAEAQYALDSAGKAIGMAGPWPRTGEGEIVCGEWGDGTLFAVWTDHQAGGAGVGASGAAIGEDGNLIQSPSYRASLTDVDLEFECRSPDGKTGDMIINGKTYKVEDGALFLVATKANPVKILQLKRDLLSMEPDRETFTKLAVSDDEIAEFFAESSGENNE